MRRKQFDHLKGEAALAAKILARLAALNGRCTKRDLERAMNANTQPMWTEAWEYLIGQQCIRVSSGTHRQQLVQLLEIPEQLQPRVASKRRRRSRTPTAWFQERLPEFLRRDGYEEAASRVEAADGGE